MRPQFICFDCVLPKGQTVKGSANIGVIPTVKARNAIGILRSLTTILV